MRVSAALGESLVAFCWNQWVQLGVLGSTAEESIWAVDPEALIVLTLEVARSDPRLFDEVLDWMLLNERLLSVRRLRAMSTSSIDRQLVSGAIGWLGWQQPRARLRARDDFGGEEVVSLFHAFDGLHFGQQDPSFAAAGLLRPPANPSHKTRPPDLMAPIGLSLRLRSFLGVGIRPEAIRVLLGVRAPWMTSQALAQTSGYAKRNVHEALVAMVNARVVESHTTGGEQRYAIDKPAWAAFLGYRPQKLPTHRDWPQLFSVLRAILRWSQTKTRSDESEYMRASGARALLEELRPELSFAGIAIPLGVTAETAVAAVAHVTDALLAALDLGPIAAVVGS